MPLTPFHLGPALLFGLLLFRCLDFPTFLIGNIIVDVEPFLVLYFGLRYPLHGFFHTLVGGSIVAAALSLGMFKLNRIIAPIMSRFKLEQKSSMNRMLFTSLAGVYFHILLDSPLYFEMKPFYPINMNPLFVSSAFYSTEVYFCILSFLAGMVLYIVRLIRQR